jgi:hypothetical protein
MGVVNTRLGDHLRKPRAGGVMMDLVYVTTEMHGIYSVIKKSRNPVLTHWVLEMSTAFCIVTNTEGRPERFLTCTLPVSRKRFTRRDTVDLFGTGKSGNVPLNIFRQSKVRTRCKVVFDSEHSLHLWKTSLHFDYWKTTDGLAQAGYNMTWHAWALIQSQRWCVFVNPVELY